MSDAGYRWDPEDYAAYSAPQFTWAQELIDKMALAGRESVLDLGCGDGKVSAQIAARLPRGRVVGVDLSQEMVEHARRNFPPEKFPSLNFQHADITDLRFDHDFDIAFSNAALHWVHDQGAVLRGLRKALKMGGRLLFQLGGRGNAAGMLHILGEAVRRDRWLGYFLEFQQPYTFPGPEEYRALLDAHGFRPVRVQLIEKDMNHAGLDGLEGWLRTAWMPYVHCVPPAEQAEFIGEVVGDYVSRFGIGSDGKIVVDMVRLEVEAIREG